MHCLSVHRHTNTQAGWQAGKEDRCMHILIVILIQTHAPFVSAQTDKHTGRLAGRQGRQMYAYTDSNTDACTVCRSTDRQTHRPADRQARKTDVCIH